jgi:hypothetical protein
MSKAGSGACLGMRALQEVRVAGLRGAGGEPAASRGGGCRVIAGGRDGAGR